MDSDNNCLMLKLKMLKCEHCLSPVDYKLLVLFNLQKEAQPHMWDSGFVNVELSSLIKGFYVNWQIVYWLGVFPTL